MSCSLYAIYSDICTVILPRTCGNKFSVDGWWGDRAPKRWQNDYFSNLPDGC